MRSLKKCPFSPCNNIVRVERFVERTCTKFIVSSQYMRCLSVRVCTYIIRYAHVFASSTTSWYEGCCGRHFVKTVSWFSKWVAVNRRDPAFLTIITPQISCALKAQQKVGITLSVAYVEPMWVLLTVDGAHLKTAKEGNLLRHKIQSSPPKTSKTIHIQRSTPIERWWKAVLSNNNELMYCFYGVVPHSKLIYFMLMFSPQMTLEAV